MLIIFHTEKKMAPLQNETTTRRTRNGLNIYFGPVATFKVSK